MTADDFSPIPDLQASIARRALAGIGGLLVLVGGTILTLGGALIGVAAIGLFALLMRRRKREVTRVSAWMAAVVGTMIPMTLVFVIGLIIGGGATDSAAKERAQRREQARQSQPEWLKRAASGGAPPNAAADSLAERVLQNKGVMIWLGAMGAVIASSVLGGIAGSIGWVAVMLLYRGVRGHWLRGKAASPIPTSGL